MSKAGDIIRGAGGHFRRNTTPGIGHGQPHGGEEGDIRVQMVDQQPRLYAKAGGAWYNTALYTKPIVGISEIADEAFRVNDDGSVGMGTINPGQKLEVLGVIRYREADSYAGRMNAADTGSGLVTTIVTAANNGDYIIQGTITVLRNSGQYGTYVISAGRYAESPGPGRFAVVTAVVESGTPTAPTIAWSSPGNDLQITIGAYYRAVFDVQFAVGAAAPSSWSFGAFD